MPSLAALLLGLVSGLSAVLAQDMTITLTIHDITTLSLSSLFPSSSSTQNKMLGQVPAVVYNASHPASIISKMGEQGMIAQPLPLLSGTIDYWSYRQFVTDVYVVSNGTLYIMDYKTSPSRSATVLKTIPVQPGTTCTGLDFSYLLAVVGCLNPDGSGFTLYSIVNNVTNSSNSFNFTGGYNFTGRLRLDLSSDSRFLTVFDDQSVANENQAIYLFAVEQNNTFTSWDILTQVGTSSMSAVTDAYIDVFQEQPPTLTISMTDSVTGFLEINQCEITFDEASSTASLTNCNDLGIGSLQVTAGRAKAFLGGSTPFALVWNNSRTGSSYPNILYCTQPNGSPLFTSCLSTIRGLPFWNRTNMTALKMTNYGGNVAINFQNTYTKQIWTVLNIQPYQATSTMAVSFESIIEPTQLGSFVIAQMQAFVNLPKIVKVYGDMGPANYMLQITSLDLPAPSNSSTVPLRRALIQVTQTLAGQSPQVFWIRVICLNNMTGLMGFTDQLPDFGSLTGGFAMTNMDRSWFYGNNLQLSLSSSALNQTTVFDRMDYTFDLSNQVTLQKMFVIGEAELVGTDSNSNIYYYTCGEGMTNNSVCTLQQTINPSAGYNLYKVYDTVSFPDTVQSRGVVLILLNGAGQPIIYYIDRTTPTTAPVDITFPDGNNYRDIHLINYKGTLMFFAAPSSGPDSRNLLVYTVSDPITSSSAFTLSGNVTAAMYGIPDGMMMPDKIKSCGHNDYVVEWMTGTGYIAKTWVSGTNQAGLGARPLVRVVNNVFPSFQMVDFCPMGDEFIVWDNQGHIFSTSTQADNSYYSLGLGEFGFKTITGVTCARLSTSAGVWGTDQNGNTLLATLFGNQFDNAQTKIHSVVQWPTNNVPSFAATFEFTTSGIVHVAISNGVPTCKHMILAGPYLMTGFSTSFTDPNLYMTLTAGDSTRTLTKQMNMQVLNTNVRVKVVGQHDLLQQGTIDLEQNNTIIGHVDQVSVTVPPSLQSSVSISQRYSAVMPGHFALPAQQLPMTLQSVLASNGNCLVFTSMNPSTQYVTVSVRGQGNTPCSNSDTPISLFKVVAISGRIEQDTQTAVVAYVARNGGSYLTYVLYVSLSTGQTQTISFNADMGYISNIQLARVPSNSSMVHAVFVGVRIHDRWDVYQANQGAQTLTLWDSIYSCYTLWPVSTPTGVLAFFTNYAQSSLNVYTLTTAQAAPGASQQFSFDGSFNEFQDMKCLVREDLDSTVQCGAVTYGANVMVFLVNYDNTLTIQSVASYALFAYQDSTQQDSGSVFRLLIVPGWILCETLEGHLDLYSLDFTAQGYLYTRLPDPAGVSRNLRETPRLKSSLVHLMGNGNYALTMTNGSMPIVTRVLPTGNDVSQLQAYQIQHIKLTVGTALSQNDANQIAINLGSPANPTVFNVSTFIGPTPPQPNPNPEPNPKSYAWIWITLLIILVIGAAAGGAYYFLIMKKRNVKAEDDQYYSQGAGITMEAKKENRKQSDEFS